MGQKFKPPKIAGPSERWSHSARYRGHAFTLYAPTSDDPRWKLSHFERDRLPCTPHYVDFFTDWDAAKSEILRRCRVIHNDTWRNDPVALAAPKPTAEELAEALCDLLDRYQDKIGTISEKAVRDAFAIAAGRYVRGSTTDARKISNKSPSRLSAVGAKSGRTD